MVVGRWSLVVGSIVLLPFYANAEDVDLKLRCAGTWTYELFKHNSKIQRGDENYYLTFSNNMQIMKSHSEFTCMDTKKNDEMYYCNVKSNSQYSRIIMTLDRRKLKYSMILKGSDSKYGGVHKSTANCEVATEPKI